MRRQGFTSLAALAVAFTGLATALTEPLELLGWDVAPDTYDFEYGLLSADGACMCTCSDITPPGVLNFLPNPGGLSPTCAEVL
jgi:hypothetical protein